MAKKPKLSLAFRTNAKGYFYIAPWLVGFLLFFIKPFIETVIYTFNDVGIENGLRLEYQGIANYVQLLSKNSSFLPSLAVAVGNMLQDVPAIVIFSLIAALLINHKFPGRLLVRIIFFLPVIYGTGLILQIQEADPVYQEIVARMGGTSEDTVMGAMLGNQLINQLTAIFSGKIGSAAAVVEYILGVVTRIFSIINRSGVQILIFLAALKSIPDSMYEASRIEGATRIEEFWKITLPLLTPYIFTNIIYSIVDSFTHVDNPMIVVIKDTMFGNLNMDMGATMAMIYFVCIVAVLGLTALIFFVLTRERKGRRSK